MKRSIALQPRRQDLVHPALESVKRSIAAGHTTAICDTRHYTNSTGRERCALPPRMRAWMRAKRLTMRRTRHNRHRESHNWIHCFDITSARDIIAAPPRLRPFPLIGLEEKRGGTEMRPHLSEKPSACLHTPRFENQGHVQILPTITRTAPRMRNGTERAAARPRTVSTRGRRRRPAPPTAQRTRRQRERTPGSPAKHKKEARQTQSTPRPSSRGSLQLTVR